MNETTHVGKKKLPGTSTKNENGGVSTAEPEMGILKAKIRGCDWECKRNTAGETTCQC
jgi:hypothetical protein